MSEIKSYKDVFIWQKGMDITSDVYQLVQSFPNDELYALTGQIKRASVTIPSNFAEGFGRNSVKSYINFLKISRGSLYELETQLIIAETQNFVTDIESYSNVLNHIVEEGKMINSYINKLEASIKNYV